MPNTVTNGIAVVVDDDPVVHAILGAILERCGYSVTIATTATAGISAVRNRLAEINTANMADRSGSPLLPQFVVFVDFLLPDRSGIGALEEIGQLSNSRGISRILLSANPENILRAQCPFLECPGKSADYFLPKPFGQEDVLAALQSVSA